MSCTLATLAACFQLSGLYIEGAADIRDYDVERYTASTNYRFVGSFEAAPARYPLIDRNIQVERAGNPYGSLALGYQLQFSDRFALSFEAFHVSSIADGNDRGVNGFAFRARWFPFGGAL